MNSGLSKTLPFFTCINFQKGRSLLSFDFTAHTKVTSRTIMIKEPFKKATAKETVAEEIN